MSPEGEDENMTSRDETREYSPKKTTTHEQAAVAGDDKKLGTGDGAVNYEEFSLQTVEAVRAEEKVPRVHSTKLEIKPTSKL